MDLYELADQIVTLLQGRGKLTYRVLKLQFKLDDETFEALKEELPYSQSQVSNDEGKGLIGTDKNDPKPASCSQPALTPAPEELPAQAEPIPF